MSAPDFLHSPTDFAECLDSGERLPLRDAVVLQRDDAWLLFHSPCEIVQAWTLPEVARALAQVEDAVQRGRYAAGFITYEAAPAFDEALVAQPPGALPLLWFGVYDRPRPCVFPRGNAPDYTLSAWTPSVSFAEYGRAIERIKAYIAAGDTYQVNYTWRLRADFRGSAWGYFQALCRAQRAGYRAFVDIGDHALCSLSPELFFTRRGTEVCCRPMKGTAARGRTTAEDRQQAERLRGSKKDRAENVMIVDMIRNDLGHIARTGSVQTTSLFDMERYDTLWQMTSTVTAATEAATGELLRALFPCASITGAPKVRTAEIIAELESAPRGIYTGSIGYLGPGGEAHFNVAIRTAHIDRARQQAEYGAGGGIVWDSVTEGEYRECRTKALVVLEPARPFSLLETLCWRPGRGYYLLRRHLARLADSAAYFGIPVDCGQVEARLREEAARFTGRRRVRLLVARDGEIAIESAPLDTGKRGPWRVALAQRPIDPADRFLYHKTTRRDRYTAARAETPACDDVLLWNPRGEITESTIANVVIRRHGDYITPPVCCGLLPGTYRAHLLARGRLREGIITREDLYTADAVFLINSVRGWLPTEVLSPCPR